MTCVPPEAGLIWAYVALAAGLAVALVMVTPAQVQPPPIIAALPIEAIKPAWPLPPLIPDPHPAPLPAPEPDAVIVPAEVVAVEEVEPEMPETIYEAEVLPEQEARNPELVRRLREVARDLARHGAGISSDDVHKAHPIPQGIDPRIMGAVFKPSNDWIRVGYKQSVRRENHGRTIAVWMLKEAKPA